jgi:thiamine kinase-like enzyme
MRTERQQPAAALLAGSLVHRDLNPTNFIITPGRAWLADWGWAVRGPAWLTPALLVLTR